LNSYTRSPTHTPPIFPLFLSVPCYIIQGAEAINIAVSQAAIAGHKASQKLMLEKMQQIYKDAGLPVPGAGGMGQ
jgi:hypothetical protein